MRPYLLAPLAVALLFGTLACGGGDSDGVEGPDSGGDESDAGSQQNVPDPGTTVCEGCLIDSICYPDGVSDPSNGCAICEVTESATEWSSNDGARCDDGQFCNGTDACSDGTCSIHENPPCVDDGQYCNGSEACDEEGDICEHSGNPCPSSELCHEETDGCVLSCTGCVIDGVCYGDGQDNPDNECEYCSRSDSTTAWSDNDGATCDDGEFCTVDDECSSGECAGTARDCDDGVYCNGVDTCDETDDECKHAGDPCDDGAFCNGEEVCNTNTDSCENGSSPCGSEDEICYEDEDQCCMPEAALGCNGDGEVADFDSCGHEGDFVKQCPVAQVCQDGACGCADGISTGDDCTRCVVFVNGASGSDANSGASWGLATETVQAGIAAAEPEGCEVWVAAGTYYPTETPGGAGSPEREFSIHLEDGVDVYGGFVGGEFSREQRDFENNLTILSGDIGAERDGSDNVYHVVTGANNATIDGFTITEGNADGESLLTQRGGGMYNYSSSSTVRNCVFLLNSAVQGGGIANISGDGVTMSTEITNCRFEGNISEDGGGMYTYANNASTLEIQVTDCVFSGNSATGDGGGISNEVITTTAILIPTLINGTFIGNTAKNGGGIHDAAKSGAILPTRRGCTFIGNTASSYGGGLRASANSSAQLDYTLTDCTFENNSAGMDGGGLYNTSTVSSTMTAVLDACVFRNNTAVDYGGGAYAYSNNAELSATYTNCSFEANAAEYGGGVCGNSSAGTMNALFMDTEFQNNKAVSAGGGMYSSTGNSGTLDQMLVNAVFRENSSFERGGGMYVRAMSSGTTTSRLGNCTFAGNAARLAGGGMTMFNSSSTINTAEVNSIMWGNWPDELEEIGTITMMVAYSDIQQEAGIYTGEGNINQDPLYANIPVASRLTIADGIASTLLFEDADSTFNVDDVIEVANDGVARVVTGSVGKIVTFTPALDAPSSLGTLVQNWGPGATDLELNPRIGAGSPCVDAATDEAAPFADKDGSMRVDIDPEETDGSYTDMGAYEYNGPSCKPSSVLVENGHYYWEGCVESNRADALAYCNHFNGSLVSITSEEENDAVVRAMNAGSVSWIGAYLDSTWQWTDGETWGYTNWYLDEPATNSVYASISYGRGASVGTWVGEQDDPFGITRNFVCEGAF